MPTPGPLELVIILVIALIILGPGKLPDVGASLGKSIREFRKASSDIQESVTVKVDTSPLPAQAPAAPLPNTLVAPAVPNTLAAAAPQALPMSAEATDGAARIAELERQLAESRGTAQEAASPLAASTASRVSGGDASS